MKDNSPTREQESCEENRTGGGTEDWSCTREEKIEKVREEEESRADEARSVNVHCCPFIFRFCLTSVGSLKSEPKEGK